MRSLIGLYLSIGIVLFVTGPCPDKNKDMVSDVVFIMGWPVYLYDGVVQGNAASPQWLHKQACEGGVTANRRAAPLR